MKVYQRWKYFWVKPEHLLDRWGYYQNWLSSEVNDNMISLTSLFDQNNKDDSATSKVYFCKSKHNFTVWSLSVKILLILLYSRASLIQTSLIYWETISRQIISDSLKKTYAFQSELRSKAKIDCFWRLRCIIIRVIFHLERQQLLWAKIWRNFQHRSNWNCQINITFWT